MGRVQIGQIRSDLPDLTCLWWSNWKKSRGTVMCDCGFELEQGQVDCRDYPTCLATVTVSRA